MQFAKKKKKEKKTLYTEDQCGDLQKKTQLNIHIAEMKNMGGRGMQYVAERTQKAGLNRQSV